MAERIEKDVRIVQTKDGVEQNLNVFTKAGIVKTADGSNVEATFATVKQSINAHAGDAVAHVTQADRNRWDGKVTGHVFSTVTEMNAKLADEDFKNGLNPGDKFYIVAEGVPDYWWDGSEVQISEGEKVDLSGYYSDAQIDDKLSGKVDAVSGKGLSSNDYTNDEKTKLSGIETGANKYTHPNNSTTRHVTDEQIGVWNAKANFRMGASVPTDLAENEIFFLVVES